MNTNPLKIAIVCPYPLHTSGGVQRHIHDYSKHMSEQGHTVHLVSPSDQMDIPNHIQLGKTYGVKGGKYIANSSETYYSRVGSSSPVLAESYDIIHVHEPMLVPPFYYGIKVAKNNNAIHIAHIHAMNPAIFEQFKIVSIPLLRRKMQLFHRIVATSKYSAGPYKNAGFDVAIVPNGVNISTLGPNVPKIKEYQDGIKNVMFLGRTDERKGLKYLYEAWPELYERFQEKIRLIIAGGRTENEVKTMKSWAEGLKGREMIIFEGSVSEERKASLYATADVFVSPATGSESFGMVLNEAMASGTPVVAFDNPGYRVVLEDKMSVCLAKLLDVSDLVTKIENILRDGNLQTSLAQWGIEQVRNKYDWNIVASQIESIYRSELAKANTSLPEQST